METHKILIVDDNPDNLAVSARLLKRAGYEVITAPNGLEGTRLAKETLPDLILLDVLLPDISGYEVCRLIKDDPLTQHILVVYLTAINRSPEIKAEGYKVGGDGHIIRPISNNEFLAIVESYLRLSQMVKTLKKAEARYNFLSEVSIEGIVIHDGVNILDLNNTMLKMMGYGSLEEAKEVPSLLDFVAPGSRQDAERRLREGYEGSYMINLKRKDGSIFPAELHVKNINYYGANARVVSVRDITDKLMIERELKIALDKALEASRLKSQFVANVSHELRTPLNAIMLMNELLEKTNPTPEQREYIELIKTSAETLLSLINDILDLSKIEAGKLLIEEIDFDLNLILSEVVSMFRPQATHKKLDIYCHLDSSIPKVLRGDPTRIKQVLMNLLGNAIKFTDYGNVSISVILHGKDTESDTYTLLFQVSDTGKGISQERQEAIFESFTQEDSSINRRYGGTGLGLTISLNLVRLMGGTMWVDSEVGKGSTFYFTLPLKKSSLSSVERALIKDRQDEYETQLSSLQKLKILLVEDNLINQMLTKRLLNAHGHDVRTVSTGLDALWALTEEGNFDLVLMDLHLPDLDGIKTTKIIRGIENYSGIAVQNPNIPVVALTANAMKEDLDQCIAAGMNNYLTKPFSSADLMRVIYGTLLNIKGKGGISQMQDYKGEAIGIDNDILIDRTKALELLGGDEEMLDQVYDMFVSYVPVQLGELKEALNSNDLERLGRLSHSLKSNAGTIGCERLRAEAYKMEMAAKAGDLEAFNIGFSEFQGLLDRVLIEIGKMKRA